MSNKTIDRINSLLYRSASFTTPLSMRQCSKELPFVIMPIEGEESFWVLNQSGKVLGEDHNKVRDADMVHPDDLDLTSLRQEPDGNYYLWDKITPDSTPTSMLSYRNILGKVIKASRKIMNGNRGLPKRACIGG